MSHFLGIINKMRVYEPNQALHNILDEDFSFEYI